MSGVSRNRIHQKAQQRHSLNALEDLKALQHQTNDKWYKYQPETVTENEKVTILWDMQVHTDKTIKANKPDIIIKDNQEKTGMLIDMANPLRPKYISKSSRETVQV